MTEKTVGIYKPSAICEDMFCSNWITKKSWKDVSVQSVQINNCNYVKERKEKDSHLYRGHKLFLSEDWFEVVRVNCGIASISPFIINILLPSKSVWFGAKTTRMESNNKIELREILGPSIYVIYKSTCLEIMSLQWNHLQIIQACLPRRPPFLQHVLWQCCNHPGILSSTVEMLLFNSVFYDGVTSVSVSTLKPLLRVIGVLPLKSQAFPKLSVCI